MENYEYSKVLDLSFLDKSLKSKKTIPGLSKLREQFEAEFKKENDKAKNTLDYKRFKENFEFLAPKILQVKFKYKLIKFDLLSGCDLHFKYIINDKLTLIIYIQLPNLNWNQHPKDWLPSQEGNFKLIYHYKNENIPAFYTLLPRTLDETIPLLNQKIPELKRDITRFEKKEKVKELEELKATCKHEYIPFNEQKECAGLLLSLRRKISRSNRHLRINSIGL